MSKRAGKDNILDKIKKCLALAGDAGATEHEAAAALRQAQALMREHNLGEADVLAAEASEKRHKAGALSRPAAWETALAASVAGALGCRGLFAEGSCASHWVFVGVAPGPEVAEYAFKTLLRQVKAARKAYVAGKLKRCKQASKTMRADVFCMGWVRAATRALAVLTLTERQAKAVALYMERHYPRLEQLKPTDRNAGKKVKADDFLHGLESGRQARLHNGVGSGAGEIRALGDESFTGRAH